MSNTPSSITPSSSGEFRPDLNPFFAIRHPSPEQATSVPSNQWAVSPQDQASNDGKQPPIKYVFTSAMANDAARAVDSRQFDSVVSWHQAAKPDGAMTMRPPYPPPKQKPASRKRNAQPNSVEPSSSSQPKQPKPSSFPMHNASDEFLFKTPIPQHDNPAIKEIYNDLCAGSALDEKLDDNPLRKMERMTNIPLFDNGMNTVVSSAGSMDKTRDAEKERNAKMQTLEEIEKSFTNPMLAPLSRPNPEPQLMAPSAGKEEWEKLMGAGSSNGAPSTSESQTSVPPAPAPEKSPMYPPPNTNGMMPTGPQSAGVYPSPYPQYSMPSGPNSAGTYPPPMPNGKANGAPHPAAAHGMPQRMMQPQMNYPGGYPPMYPWPPMPNGMQMGPPPPNHPAYQQWVMQQQAMAYQRQQMMAAQQQAMNKAAAMNSPGQYPSPMMQGPPPTSTTTPTSTPSATMPPNGMPYHPSMQMRGPYAPPPYFGGMPGMPGPGMSPGANPGMPPHPGYGPYPGMMPPGMMMHPGVPPNMRPPMDPNMPMGMMPMPGYFPPPGTKPADKTASPKALQDGHPTLPTPS
ncbi:unnamed protein product, partial [Mesorhabditis spiculigera]